MPSQHLVVIGASAGGIETLRALAADLPADFPAPICVVLHMAAESPGVLPQILNRSGPLRAVQASSRMRISPGQIYTAPPDCHLLVEPGRLIVTKGPRENRFRPAIDPLFRSAAQVYGPGTIGVVLSGNLDDGTAGLWAIKQLGGIAIVQDPAEALFPAMPEHARRHVAVDHVASIAVMSELLNRLASTAVQDMGDVAMPDHLKVEVNIAKEQNAVDAGIEQVMKPSKYACPECHGVLLQMKEEGRVRFRCHTGHAYSSDSLVAAVSEGIEGSLWEAVRSLEEGALLLTDFAEHARTHANGEDDAKSLLERASNAHRQANAIRELLTTREPLAAGVKS